MCRCEECDQFPAHPNNPTVPCPHGNTTAYDDPESGFGTKQIPLLKLVYQLCPSLVPQMLGERKVRAIWRAPLKGKNGDARYPYYTITREKAATEVHQMVGMYLAQRVRTLPVWAQLGFADQEMFASIIARRISGSPTADMNENLLFSRLNGTMMDPFESQQIEKRIGQCQQEMQATLNLRSNFAQTAEPRLRDITSRLAKLQSALNVQQLAADDRARMIEERTMLTSEAEWITKVGGGQITWADALETLEAEYQFLAAQFEQLKIDWQISQYVQEESARERQLGAQSSLDGDFALQRQNYRNPTNCDRLVAALAQETTARQLFLYLHPQLKYEWSEQTMCKITNLLTCNAFLAPYNEANTSSLVQPGPHARLGIFIVNSLSPGAYSDKQRKMVQTELEEIRKGMHEHRMGAIVCHSCGSPQFGDPTTRGWIRDHNPPTAFVELMVEFGPIPALNMPFYNRRAQAGTRPTKQVLLPQCMECSIRQGSLTNKVVAILREGLKGPNAALIRQNAIAYIQQQLNNQTDWNDCVRVIFNPGCGWRSPAQPQVPLLGLLQDGVPVVATLQGAREIWEVVTSGGPGSFSGVSNDLIKELGDNLGCHTCIDVPIQSDPFRKMNWIADHQPPTGLVERGLMELPQVIYPHCFSCSNKQSKLVARMVAAFDACMGKEWKEQWVQRLKDSGAASYDF